MSTLQLAGQALRTWSGRTWFWALIASAGTALLIGIPTVMIPNPVFARDIPVVWWNYPVWLLTSILAGMLVATYIRVKSDNASSGLSADGSGADGADGEGLLLDPEEDPTSKKQGRLALTGSLLGWFAVGCPVCNKLALIALGYTGALTWFAPIQPFLGLGALALTGAALLMRLRGQVACPMPKKPKSAVPVEAL